MMNVCNRLSRHARGQRGVTMLVVLVLRPNGLFAQVQSKKV